MTLPGDQEVMLIPKVLVALEHGRHEHRERLSNKQLIRLCRRNLYYLKSPFAGRDNDSKILENTGFYQRMAELRRTVWGGDLFMAYGDQAFPMTNYTFALFRPPLQEFFNLRIQTLRLSVE